MIPAPDPNRSIVNEEGIMEDPFRRFTTQVSKLSIIVGVGSPEGIVEGLQAQEYMDQEGISGAIKYIKRDPDILGDRTKGWILI